MSFKRAFEHWKSFFNNFIFSKSGPAGISKFGANWNTATVYEKCRSRSTSLAFSTKIIESKILKNPLEAVKANSLRETALLKRVNAFAIFQEHS